MNYLVFDFSVAFCVVGVILSTYYGFNTAPENMSSDFDRRSPSCETCAEPGFTPTTTRLLAPGPGEGEASGAFPMGSIVEVRGIHSAFPAIVTGVEEEGEGNVYNLTKYALVNAPLKSIDAQFVHPYHVYEDGTPATCDVRELGEISRVPCTVLSHLDRGEDHRGDPIFYEVILTEEQTTFFLPRLMVQRNLKDAKLDIFPVGSVVEFHGSRYAFPATVTGVTEDKKGTLYHLDHGFANASMTLPVELVHPYHMCEGGTRALCNVPMRRGEINLVPCSVVSHWRDNDQGVVWYQVKATLGKGDERTLTLSRMNVQGLFKVPPKDM